MTIAMRRPRVSAVHAAGRVAVGKQSHRAPNTMPMRMAAADQTVSVVDVANPTAATHRQINAVQPTRRRRSISDGAALVIRVAVCKRIGVMDRRDMHSFQSSSPGTHCTGGSWGLAVHNLNPNHDHTSPVESIRIKSKIRIKRRRLMPQAKTGEAGASGAVCSEARASEQATEQFLSQRPYLNKSPAVKNAAWMRPQCGLFARLRREIPMPLQPWEPFLPRLYRLQSMHALEPH